jgi:Flp pilus assembly protein TadG
MRTRKQQRGSVMLEFVFAGIAAAALMITTVQIGVAMWNYHTLAYAVHETNRYIVVHGHNCYLYSNSCAISVADVAQKFTSSGVGLPSGGVNLTLTSSGGTVVSCSPVSSCATNTGTPWPPFTDGFQGNLSTISASYTFGSGIIGLWYRTPGMRIGSVTITSSSKLPIIF